LALLSVIANSLLGCGGKENEPNEPGEGALEVVAVTRFKPGGEGYVVYLGNLSWPIPINGTITVPSLASGDQSITLGNDSSRKSPGSAEMVAVERSDAGDIAQALAY